MITFQITIAITSIGIGIGLLAYLHQRNKDKPIFECFFLPYNEKSIRVIIAINNKSKNNFTITKVTASIRCAKLFVASSVHYKRNNSTSHIPTHKDFSQKPNIYVPPEGKSEFDFFAISDSSILEETIRIRLQTDASLFSMAPRNKIIRNKYPA